jgi:TolA-binding protein
MRRSLALIVPALLGLSGAVAFAQDDDMQSLLDRLSRVEREVGVLQRQVYRGVAPSGAPVAMGAPDSQTAANDEVRLGQIDEAIRGLTGQVEELKYGVDKLNQRLDKLSSDDELRFRALEQGGQNANVAQASPSPPPPALASRPKGMQGNAPPPPRSRKAMKNIPMALRGRTIS